MSDIDNLSAVSQVTGSETVLSLCLRLSSKGMQPDSSTTRLIHAPAPV